MHTFYTSDEHYYHFNIIRFSNRPFQNLQQMHHALIENHNAVVGKHDVVIHVGDFTLNATELEVRVILEQLNGKHLIMPGNHDRSRESLTRAGFELLNTPGQYSIGWTLHDGENKLPILLSHYPYFDTDPEYDQRYINRRPIDKGGPLIHGHVHQKWQMRGKQINVGVDVWNYTPVPEETLFKLFAEEVGK